MEFSEKMQENFQKQVLMLQQVLENAEKTFHNHLDIYKHNTEIYEDLTALTTLAKSFSERISTLREHMQKQEVLPTEEHSLEYIKDLMREQKAQEAPVEDSAAEEWLAKQPALPDTPLQDSETAAPKLNLQNLQNSMSSMKETNTVSSKHEQLFKDALDTLRKGLCWKNDSIQKEAREELQKLEAYIPPERMQTEIQNQERRAATYINYENRLEKLLKKYTAVDAEIISFWDEIKKHHGWFITKFIKSIAFYSMHTCKNIIRSKSKEDALTFIEKIKKIYGKNAKECVKKLTEIISTYENTAMPDIAPDTEHQIHCLEPEASWVLYIDETGTGFDNSSEKARVLGVLFPENTTIRLLGEKFHCSDTSSNKVLKTFNELLLCKCGILGLNKRDLHEMSHEQWLTSVVELILWVWRLLPLHNDTKVHLKVCIEQRSSYKPEQDISLLKKSLQMQLEKEDARRYQHIDIQDLRFVAKGTELIGWADVAAYMWGSTTKEIQKGLKASGLLGKCYLEHVAELLPIWAKALRGQILTGAEWLFLMKDGKQKSSIMQVALKVLQEQCIQTPVLWKSYVDTTAEYLASKEYDITVLEKLCAWLGKMQDADLPKDLQFLWKLSKLAQYNHNGDVSLKVHTIRHELETLSQEIRQLKLEAQCHTALRIAVSYANAFDFTKAKEVLSPWNTLQGGRSLESALWDGKVLSSLGQYAAFEGKTSQALEYFDAASEMFEKLHAITPAEGQRQCEQTSVYAAIASMDIPALSDDDRKQRIEQALGESVLTACEKFSSLATPATRYVHHMLVRYLAQYGTAEEKQVYSKHCQRWHLEDRGVGQGHPWPLIQWYRWSMLPESMHEEKEKIMRTLFEYCWGNTSGATVDLIGITLGVAAKTLSPSNAEVQKRLQQLMQIMPCATRNIQYILEAQETGLPLVKKVLPFNYR